MSSHGGCHHGINRAMERCMNCDDRETIAELREQVAALTKQLPDEMKHCTIVFKECAVGHGRLTATNWVDHECPVCEVAALTQERDKAEAFRQAAYDVSVKHGEALAASQAREARLRETMRDLLNATGRDDHITDAAYTAINQPSDDFALQSAIKAAQVEVLRSAARQSQMEYNGMGWVSTAELDRMADELEATK